MSQAEFAELKLALGRIEELLKEILKALSKEK